MIAAIASAGPAPLAGSPKPHAERATSNSAVQRTYVAANLLRKSQWALTHIPYEGREMSVTWADGRTESAVALRSHYKTHERTEYVAPKTLAGHIYLADAHYARIYNPKRRQVYVTPREEGADIDLPLLLKNYRLILDPKLHSVADHECHVIRLQPRDSGKPSRIIWLDKASDLPLKHERFHADGSPAASTEFTEVKIDGLIPASRFKLSLPANVKEIVQTTKRMGASPPRPRFITHLPAGYQLQNCTASTVANGWHCLYSDGADVVSLFALPTAGQRHLPREGAVRLGSYPAVLQRRSHHWIVSWIEGRNRLALVGDLSRDRILALARAVARG